MDDVTVDEVWVPVKSFEDFYEVSVLGRVRSVKRRVCDKYGRWSTKPGKVLGQRINPASDYNTVVLSRGGIPKSYGVHYLVAEAFLLSEGDAQRVWVKHKDANKRNNAVWNLCCVERHTARCAPVPDQSPHVPS